MADHSNIEWTDATWQIITGCSILSPGCARCYAMKLAGTRLRHHPSREGLTVETKNGPVWNGEVRFNRQWLLQPLGWKKPRNIFVCAHGDLFHENVPDEWIDRVFAVMALAPQHTFQVLTKRAKRMCEYVSAARDRIVKVTTDGNENVSVHTSTAYHSTTHLGGKVSWPLPNVWLGVSAERHQEADERIPHLLATPAAVRFISAEPLLGPIDLIGTLARWQDSPGRRCAVRLGDQLINWVIVGGESGDGARPMDPEWARALRDQCASAGIPFFFKQWGAWAPGEWEDTGDFCRFSPDDPSICIPDLGKYDHWRHRVHWFDPLLGPDGPGALMLGKAKAGRLLDGREHNGMPQVRR